LREPMDNTTRMYAAAIIKHYEGLRLKAYRCPAGVWTIGYGHTGGIKENDEITESDADRLLYQDMHDAFDCIEHYVDEDLTDYETAALISLVFNIGCNAFRGSQICRLLNEGNMKAAAQQFQWWRKGGGQVLPGLVKRRESERRLFVDGQIVL